MYGEDMTSRFRAIQSPMMLVWRLLKRAVSGWMDDRAMRLAASLSFFTMLSLGPLLLITLRVVGLILGPEAAAGQLQFYLQQVIGPGGAELLQEVIAAAGEDDTGGNIATAASIGILVFSASYVFAELQDAMNTVWDVPTPEGWAVWRMIRNRLVAFAMVLSLAFLLLVSMVISSVMAALAAYVMPEPGRIGQAINFLVSLGVTSTVFAILFKYIPDVHIRWRDVWPGSVLTAVLFTIGQLLVGMYLGQATVVGLFGAAGSLVALLLWVYYTAMIVFFGAEFTKGYIDWRAASRPDALVRA
jgi:membrane protein